MKIHNSSMRIAYRCINRTSTDIQGWTDGDVLTPDGIVAVYAQGDDIHKPHTRLDFVYAGRLYMRDFENVRYSQRGLVKKAREFAAEIVRGVR